MDYALTWWQLLLIEVLCVGGGVVIGIAFWG